MARLNFFPVPFLLGLGGLLILLPLAWLWKRRWGYVLTFALFGFYLLLVAGLTLFPIPLPLTGEARRSLGEIVARVNLVPFLHWRSRYAPYLLRSEMIANILMTIPFGFMFPLLVRVRFWHFLVLAVLLGLGIEITQLALSLVVGLAFRVTDINDVLMNGAGAMVGYGLYGLLRLFQWLARRRARAD